MHTGERRTAAPLSLDKSGRHKDEHKTHEVLASLRAMIMITACFHSMGLAKTKPGDNRFRNCGLVGSAHSLKSFARRSVFAGFKLHPNISDVQVRKGRASRITMRTGGRQPGGLGYDGITRSSPQLQKARSLRRGMTGRRLYLKGRTPEAPHL